MDEFLNTALKVTGIVGALGVPTLVGIYFTYKLRKEADLRKVRREETILLLEGIQTIGQLAFATALAYLGRKPNGEMDTAIADYSGYAPRLRQYITKQAVEQTH